MLRLNEDERVPLLKESNLLRSIVRDSFYEFLMEFWDILVGEELIDNWHIKYLCDELQTVAERVIARKRKEYDLIINVPPGSTKSTICTQAFPAWVWTRMPQAQFLCGSYAYMVALKDSLKTRDVVQSDKYKELFPEIVLRIDENKKELFTNTKKGKRLSVGVGGLATGFHAHFQLVDDPISPEEAFSAADLKRANRWFTQTLPTRKANKITSVLILIQQRLHEADPSGELLARAAKGRAKVRHICLPGDTEYEIKPPELKRFYINGLLDPVRAPAEVLQELKDTLGLYGYAAQVGQNPVPAGGGLFQVDKIHLVDDYPERIVRAARSWDKAGTEDGGNWSAGGLMGVDNKGRYWILDMNRGQWGSYEREEHIASTAEFDGDEMEILLEIEGGSGGKESAQNTVKNLAGYKVIAKHPTGPKEARAYAFSSQVGAGNVYCLKRAWTQPLIDELRYFPAGKYDDQVDCLSQAFNHIARKARKIGLIPIGDTR